MLEKFADYKTVVAQYHAGLTSFYALCCEMVKILLGDIKIIAVNQLQPAARIVQKIAAPPASVSVCTSPASPSAPMSSIYEHFQDPNYWYNMERLQLQSQSEPALPQMDPIPPIFCAAVLLLIRFLLAKGPRIVRDFFKVRTDLGPKITDSAGLAIHKRRHSVEYTKWLRDGAPNEEAHHPLEYLDCI